MVIKFDIVKGPSKEAFRDSLFDGDVLHRKAVEFVLQPHIIHASMRRESNERSVLIVIESARRVSSSCWTFTGVWRDGERFMKAEGRYDTETGRGYLEW